MSLEKTINLFHIFHSNPAVPSFKMSDDKRNVYFRNNGLQFQDIGTMVKRMCRRNKHFLHQMPFTACKNKTAVAELLNVSTQKSLYVFLRIFGYLLKFINGNNARPIGIAQIMKNLFQGIFRAFYVP